MARPAGLEPATLGLEGRCSIRLSYGRSVLPALNLVGMEGFEPPTSCTQSKRATKLRYIPKTLKNREKVHALDLLTYLHFKEAR